MHDTKLIMKLFIALFISLVGLVACSKEEAPKPSPNIASLPTMAEVPGGQEPDYKLICEKLIPLAPDARRATFAATCLAEYKQMFPACKNASAVNDCYANLKDWSGRLACLDSCVRK